MSVYDELMEIQRRDGTLKPRAVVEFAENPETELHKHFDWRDDDAADKWRLHQARQIIRVTVEVLESDTRPIRAFVSLYKDRKEGNGYRTIVDVLSDDDRRGELLEQALRELQHFRKKYEHLNELAGVFEAVDQIELPIRKEEGAESTLTV